MKSKILALLLLIVPILLLAGSDHKQKSQTTSKAHEEKITGPALPAAKYAHDDDGALRATTDKENRELSNKLQQTLKKYSHHQMVTDTKGSSLVIAPFNFRWSVVTVGPYGKLQYSCASNLKEIDAAAQPSTKTDIVGQKFEKE